MGRAEGLQLREPEFGQFRKLRHLGRLHGGCPRERHRQGILEYTIHPELVVQMGAADQTRCTRQRDDVTLADSCTLSYTRTKTGQVTIDRRVAPLVTEDDHLPVAALHPDEFHNAVGSCPDARPDGGSVIHAPMRSPFLMQSASTN